MNKQNDAAVNKEQSMHTSDVQSNIDSVDTSPEHVEKTAKSIHDKPTNFSQKSTELVEPQRLQRAGSFGSD